MEDAMMKDVRTSGNDGRHIEGAPSNKVDMCADLRDKVDMCEPTDRPSSATLAAECRTASKNKALSIGEAWELLERAADAFDTLAAPPEIAGLDRAVDDDGGM